MSEAGALALFVPADRVWEAQIDRGWVIIKAFQVAADRIVLHNGRASGIAADIHIAANLIAYYVDSAAIAVDSQIALHHTTTSPATEGIVGAYEIAGDRDEIHFIIQPAVLKVDIACD